MNVANQIVRKLLREARCEGFHAFQTYDGEEMNVTYSDENVMDVVDSVADSVIHFKNKQGQKFWVYVIPSNDEDVICDYASFEHAERIMNRVIH